MNPQKFPPVTFQSTPSAWRETPVSGLYDAFYGISIHSLRMEGDLVLVAVFTMSSISIHSLRMEGDSGGLRDSA